MFTGMMMAGRPRIQKNITISADVENYDLITDDFGGVAPTAPTTVVISVSAAVNVYSSTTATAAMDLRGLPTGSTVALTNLGLIVGMGGAGGDGRDVDAEEESGDCFSIRSGGSVGGDGGIALLIDGDVDITITNGAGEIFAGGGGGGGGDACQRTVTPCSPGAGGGGGGGAGSKTTGGAGGTGGDATLFLSPVCSGDSGNAGTGGSSGAAGSGGSGCGGACTGSAGGAGGAYGAAGSVGSGTGGKAGGAAANSVSHTGTGSVTYATGGVQGVDIKGATD